MEKQGKLKNINIVHGIVLFIRKNLSLIILLVGIIGFLALTNEVFSKELLTIDVVGYNLISKFLISDFITPVFKFITNFGGVVCLTSLTFLSFILVKNKNIGLSVACNLIVITLFNLLLKNIFQRPRPLEYRIINETGYSFPSGHSMVSMAFYGFIMYLIYKYVKDKKLKWSLFVFLMILILFIGISRIYLGVHYTSDVLAGVLFSSAYLILYIKVVKKYVLK